MVDIIPDLSSEGESNYKIAQELFNIEKNIDSKTELSGREINKLLRRDFVSKCLSNNPINLEELNTELAGNFKKLRVSLNRKGRGEAVSLGKVTPEPGSMKNSWFKNFLGIRQ